MNDFWVLIVLFHHHCVQLRAEHMQINWTIVGVERAEDSKSVCWIHVLGQTKVHDSTRSQRDSKDILWKCHGHAEDIFAEHFCNDATDRLPHTGDDGAGTAWLLVITTPVHDDFPESLPDGVTEITGDGFAPSVVHPPSETRGSDRRDMGGVTFGLPRAAHFHVVVGPCVGGVVSPFYVCIIRVVRLQPQKCGFQFHDIDFE